MVEILLSGGFDPIHTGHIAYLEEAESIAEVVVALNSDEWLIRKKGYFFQSFEERKKILESLWCVSEVIPVDDSDGTVCKAIEERKPHYFGKGGDRTKDNTPEIDTCNRNGVVIKWGLGGGKTAHSSLIGTRGVSTWGPFKVYDMGGGVKRAVQHDSMENIELIFSKESNIVFLKNNFRLKTGVVDGIGLLTNVVLGSGLKVRQGETITIEKKTGDESPVEFLLIEG